MLHKILGGAKPLIAAAAMMSLAACAGMQLDSARGLTPEGDAFSQALYQEYLALAEAEFAEGDYQDSDVFASRAIASAAGTPPGPEALDARNIPAEHKGALSEAHRRLTAALDAGAAGKVPEASARGQAMFDCWMQEAEENIQPADIAWCRDRFKVALEVMEAAVAEQPAAPAPAAPPVTFANFTVYFDFDSSTITPQTLSTLIDAADASDDMGASTITVSGYADRSGSEAYNMALSQRRADAVAAELKGLLGDGAPAMTLEAFGEKNNKVVTPDGVKEAKNRRVKIEIRK
jgi:outer membrane protein OmpA-like peptidoglycan-associated protein